MSGIAGQVVAGTTMTYQEVIQGFIWNMIEFFTCLAIIAFVLDHFGWIRAAPIVEGNVTEQVDESFKGFGSFLKESIVEGTKLAKTINSVVAETNEVEAVAPKVKAAGAK